jgi:aryl-alcohol dehydrogenase-like predicted oxidoreductase
VNVEYRYVGSTGLQVSTLGLGTMTWSRDTDDVEAASQLAEYVESGGNLIDTASSYGAGGAEELIGSLLGLGIANRDELVICTKSGSRLHDGHQRTDASRRTMLLNLEQSLQRLGTDYVDLWLVQRPDSAVRLEETLSALDSAQRSGKTRYVGLSNHPAWMLARAHTLLGSDPLGCAIAAAQVEYSLLNRKIETELLPAATALGIGLLAWSPLGRGVLTGKYRYAIPPDSRAASAHLSGFVAPYLNNQSAAVVEAVAAAADGLGVAPLDVSLAWARARPGVASAILGARTASQLHSALIAEDLVLPDAITAALDEVSASRINA